MGDDDMPIPIELWARLKWHRCVRTAANVCGHSSRAGSDCKNISIGWQPGRAEDEGRALHQRSSQARPANEGSALTEREPDDSRGSARTQGSRRSARQLEALDLRLEARPEDRCVRPGMWSDALYACSSRLIGQAITISGTALAASRSATAGSTHSPTSLPTRVHAGRLSTQSTALITTVTMSPVTAAGPPSSSRLPTAALG